MHGFNPVKSIGRRGVRIVLAGLSHWALRKHKPEVIAVVGEGKAGIAREAIYQVLKCDPPVRRNIETPDAEFVLPLVILGVEEYPCSYLSWLKTVAKAAGQLLFRPAYKHRLVLEIGYTNKKIFDYFWRITRPLVLVICGKAPYLSENQIAEHTFRIEPTEDIKPYLRTAIEVAKIFGIHKEAAQKELAKFSLPPARIRIIAARAGGLLIDATYQYYPPSKRTLNEILEALPGRKIFLDPNSPKRLRSKPPQIKKGEIGVLLGEKKAMWPVILELAKTPWTD